MPSVRAYGDDAFRPQPHQNADPSVSMPSVRAYGDDAYGLMTNATIASDRFNALGAGVRR